MYFTSSTNWPSIHSNSPNQPLSHKSQGTHLSFNIFVTFFKEDNISISSIIITINIVIIINIIFMCRFSFKTNIKANIMVDFLNLYDIEFFQILWRYNDQRSNLYLSYYFLVVKIYTKILLRVLILDTIMFNKQKY